MGEILQILRHAWAKLLNKTSTHKNWQEVNAAWMRRYKLSHPSIYGLLGTDNCQISTKKWNDDKYASNWWFICYNRMKAAR